MSHRTQLLMEFRACYDRLVAARQAGDEPEVHHAERNFYAAAESLARLVPRLVAELPEREVARPPCEAGPLAPDAGLFSGRP